MFSFLMSFSLNFRFRQKKTYTVFLASRGINLLASYHERRSLIGYTTHSRHTFH